LKKKDLVRPRGNGHGSRNDQKRDRHPILKLNAKNTDSLDEDMQSRFPLHYLKCEPTVFVSEPSKDCRRGGNKYWDKRGEGSARPD
jgi:hypothetical protein